MLTVIFSFLYISRHYLTLICCLNCCANIFDMYSNILCNFNNIIINKNIVIFIFNNYNLQWNYDIHIIVYILIFNYIYNHLNILPWRSSFNIIMLFIPSIPSQAVRESISQQILLSLIEAKCFVIWLQTIEHKNILDFVFTNWYYYVTRHT